MKIRNKLTGQIFEVVAGTLYPTFFEEVTDDEIKVGEPKIEFEIEEIEEEAPVLTEKPKNVKTEKKTTNKPKKTTKKGAKKNDNSKRN